MTLRIECPGCQQTFQVSEELDGRTVECGSCEKRFQVSPEVMAAHRERFYPDESKKEVDLSRFGRAPAASAPVEFRTMEYDNSGKQDFIGPVPPVRTFAAMIGLLVILTAVSIFYFGSQPTSTVLQDVEKPERYALAGFLGLVGFGLLSWGMIKKRVVGILLGLLGAGGLLAMAHYLPVYRTVNSGAPLLSDGKTEDVESDDRPGYFPGISGEELTAQEVMKKTRWEASVFPSIGQGDETLVAAVWVRSMQEYHGKQIQGYLKQAFGLPSLPYFRELGPEGGIFVMSGIPFDLDEVEAAVERFGEVESVIPELRLVQMQVNASVLGEVSNKLNSKLNNPEDGAFYSLNYRELIALDKERVKNAIQRLALAEPVRMRKDITIRLVGLLREDFDLATYEKLAEALNVWSEDGDGADRIVTDLGIRMNARGETIPDGMLRFIAERKTPSAANLLLEVWTADPAEKQRFVEQYGSQAAPRLTTYLGSPDPSISRSAARLLGRVGTKDQLPEMRAALSNSQDDEFKSLLEQEIKRVANR